MKDKLSFLVGVLNSVLAGVMAINTVFMLLFVIAVIALPILLPIWFLPLLIAVPIVGFIFFISLAATVCNMVSGVGSVLAAIKGGMASKIFTVISTVVDGIFIPANVMFLYFGAVLNTGGEAEAFSITLLVVATLAMALVIAGLVMNIIGLLRMSKKPVVSRPASGVTDI